MFERFTRAAREAVVQAQTEARELGHNSIGTEHVLLGVLWNAEGATSEVAETCGLGYRSIREQIESGIGDDSGDAEALGRLGIDLDEVRRRVEAQFGEGALSRRPWRGRSGHLPFAKESKKALELALREAINLKHKFIGVEHILLALTRVQDSTAAELINRTGTSAQQVHDQLWRRLQQAA